MAGPDASETVVAASGVVSVAPYGTALPTLAVAALNAAFVDIGYVSEDGVTFNDSKGKSFVPAWNSNYPVRQIPGDQNTTVAYNLLQWDSAIFAFALGGTVTTSGTDKKFTPSPPGTDFRSLVIGWADGTRHFRLVVPKGEVSGEVEMTLTRTAVAPVPVSFVSEPGAVDSPYFFLTDDTTHFPNLP